MDTNKMREQISGEFKAWLGDYEKSREANGWMPLEPFVVTHMHNAFIASREAVVVELPNRSSEVYREYFDDVEGGSFNEVAYIRDVRKAIEAQGLKVKP